MVCLDWLAVARVCGHVQYCTRRTGPQALPPMRMHTWFIHPLCHCITGLIIQSVYIPSTV